MVISDSSNAYGRWQMKQKKIHDFHTMNYLTNQHHVREALTFQILQCGMTSFQELLSSKVINKHDTIKYKYKPTVELV
jgi:hypothetical protein